MIRNLVLCLLVMVGAVGAGWLSDYRYRSAIPVNRNSITTDYQIPVKVKPGIGVADSSTVYLSSKNSVYPAGMAFTSSDGVTKIPHWFNTIDSVVYVKISANAGTDDSIYLYYKDVAGIQTSAGDSTFIFYDGFDSVATPFSATNAADKSIATAKYLGENIVYDSVSTKFWWVFEDRGNASYTKVRIASASALVGPWTVQADTLISYPANAARAPSLHKFGEKWYLYYGRDSASIVEGVWLKWSNTVNGGYTDSGIVNPILKPISKTAWDGRRVTEPYVMKRGATYYMFYMGEDTTNLFELTGLATSTRPDSGWVKFAGNPIISGSGQVWDAGQDKACDPSAFMVSDTLYVMVGGAPSGKAGWRSGLYWSTDFSTFAPCPGNPILGYGLSTAFDYTAAFRGAVCQFEGDTNYYFPYTGKSSTDFYMGLTTLNRTNGKKAWIDVNKWTVTGSAKDSAGLLTTLSASNYVVSNKKFPPNRSMVSRQAHPLTTVGAVRFGGTTGDFIEIAGSYPSSTQSQSWQHRGSSDSKGTAFAYTNGSYVKTEVKRIDTTAVRYYSNGVLKDSLKTNVPIDTAMPVTCLLNTRVDYLFVKRMSLPEPYFGAASSYTSAVSLTSITPSTGTAGTTVSLTGYGFSATPDSLSLDGGTTYVAELTVTSDSTATVVMPPHAPATVDVKVKNADGNTTLASAFTYQGGGGRRSNRAFRLSFSRQ